LKSIPPQIEPAGEKSTGTIASFALPSQTRSWWWLAALRGDLLALVPPEAFERDCLDLPTLQRCLLTNDPAAIQHVLHDNADHYSGSPLVQRAFRRTLGDSLINTEGEVWRNHRHIMAPPFTPRSVSRYATSISEATADLIASWNTLPNGAAVDLVATMRSLTITIICRTMFSTAAPDIVALVRDSVPPYLQSMRPRLLDFAANWIPGLPAGRPRKMIPALETAVERIITQRRSSMPESADLLSRLLAAVEKGLMSMSAAADHIAHMLMVGHDTTEQTLLWACYLLSLHPSLEAILHAEVDAVLAGRPPGMDDVSRLPYTRMVIEETMRLCPSVHTVLRRALADDEVAGQRLRKGSLVLITPVVIHRHRRLWKEPDRFDPERFTSDQVKARHPFAYIPFGAGPRICLGANLALLEAILIIAGISQHFRLHLVTGQRIEPFALTTLRPRYGMSMVPERRHAVA
jgi:cytochrome P450